jgi:hypothetical protein
MASIRLKQASMKTLFKLVLCFAVVIFILAKFLINRLNQDDTSIPSKAVFLDEALQNFRSNKDVSPSQNDKNKKHPENVADLELESSLNSVVQPQHTHVDFQDENTSKNLHVLWGLPEDGVTDGVHVLISLANAQSNPQLQAKFETCVRSMSHWSSVDVILFVAGDKDSKAVADRVINSLPKKNIMVNVCPFILQTIEYVEKQHK